ncbi:MAG: lipopolysaccharide heptosyltransferase II [Chthoniobacterales bacterium]
MGNCMLDYGVYLFYRVGTALVGLFPLRLLYYIGAGFGWLGWLLLGPYRTLALRNVEIAYGNTLTRRQARQLVRRHFSRLGANLLSGIKMTTMSLDAVARCVEIDEASAAVARHYSNKPAVVVLSHIANWEAIAHLLPALFGGAKMGTIYQRLRNRRLDDAIRSDRSRNGVELFDRSEGFRRATEFLRSGGGLGVFSDQHAGDHGVWTPFFNRLASTTILPALLAKRTGAAVLVSTVHTIRPARWRLTFTDRIDSPDDTINSLTAKMNAELERQLAASPEDWFWLHNRWKTPEPNFLLTHYKRGVYFPPNFQREELKPFRIVVRAPNWLGDSVISAESVRTIKHGRPDAHLTIAAPAKLAPLWRLLPEVDHVLELPHDHLLGVALLLRAQPRFDAAILLPNSLRTALEARLAGIPRVVGFRGHHRAWLLDQIAPERRKPGPIEHQVHRYARLAQSLGAPAAAPPLVHPQSSTNGLTTLGLCPGAEYGPAKRWLPDRFAEVAAAVANQQRVQWKLFGTAPDVEIGAQIEAQLSDACINRIGKTTLDELITELRECRMLLTNDTGTMHLASLLGIPVVAVFGSTEDRLTGPLGSGHTVIRHHVECSPCFLRECPIDFRCMKAVTSEEVTAAVLAKLK